MTDHPTIEQVLSDPRSADRAALDYCNEEVRNCLDKADALRDENAALWAFVDAFKRWGRGESSWGELHEALADLTPYEGGRE